MIRSCDNVFKSTTVVYRTSKLFGMGNISYIFSFLTRYINNFIVYQYIVCLSMGKVKDMFILPVKNFTGKVNPALILLVRLKFYR